MMLPVQFINEHLACQGNVNEAVTYSLITKATYNYKPLPEKYNPSFHHLITDFKNKRLKGWCIPLWDA